MRFKRSVHWMAGALVLFACAGRSISRSDGDDSGSTGDSGLGGTSPGSAGTVAGGAFGEGGNVGKGGVGATTGGTGKGGTATGGKGGTTRGGTGGVAGTGNVAGEGASSGEGGSVCLRRDVGSIYADCAPDRVTCISTASPDPDVVLRNEPAPDGGQGEGGFGGEGGSSGPEPGQIATAIVCTDEQRRGYLAFDYFMPRDGVSIPGFAYLAYSDSICGGPIVARGTLSEFDPPPPGQWTTQCISVDPEELVRVVTIAVPTGTTRPLVKNVRFVVGCQCPREVTRYNTCGDMTSGQFCR